MFRTLAAAAFALCAATGAAPASEAVNSPLVKSLFGKLAAKGATSACFTRVYAPAHLAGHPQQNVRDMVILLTASPDADAGAIFHTRIGVHFRKLGAAFETGGSCTLGEDGKSIGCSAECDGGSMDVSLKDAQTIYLKIPDGARLWQPGKDTEDNPAKARFGSDDTIFKLTRAASPRQCLSVLGKQ